MLKYHLRLQISPLRDAAVQTMRKGSRLLLGMNVTLSWTSRDHRYAFRPVLPGYTALLFRNKNWREKFWT